MSKKIQIGLFGGTGKMGNEIQKLASTEKTLDVKFAVGRVFKTPPKCQVCIDFSVGSTLKALEFCLENKIPLVSGATGLSKEEEKELLRAAKVIPVFWASNMSFGVAALKEALKSFQLISDYSFSIDEWHHKHKKDSPSGTAKTLAKALSLAVPSSKVEIQSKRAGGIFGVHKVLAIGDHEYLEFSHHALDRTLFAQGALRAARWILTKKKGFYNMDSIVSDIKKRNNG
jgi:4-hydroxy-tetrahydrodipicolinate reductase